MKLFLTSLIAGSFLFCFAPALRAEEATKTIETMPPKIELFIYSSCPWCSKVVNYLKQIGHFDDVIIVNASLPQNLNRLQKLTGDAQCPCIIDSEKNIKFMLESSDIITYFATRWTK